MARRADIASALAGAYLAGVWTEDALVRRSAAVLAPRPRWLRSVAREVLASYPRPPTSACAATATRPSRAATGARA